MCTARGWTCITIEVAVSLFRTALLVAAAALLYACVAGRGEVDSATGETDAVATPAGHPRDASPDAAFLTELSNHHEGLVLLAMTAMNNTSREATRAEAHRIHLSRMAERDSMVALLRVEFAVQHTPRVSPAHIVRADSIPGLDGEARDVMFYRLLVRHHEEGLRIIRQYLPQLQDARVRRLAERLKAEKEESIARYLARR